MTDDTPAADDESGAPLVAGERLAEARRLKQISLPDIARQLHLDEPRVQALEENRFDVLGAPVFAKGYLRKYAELVGVPVDDIMADYYTINRATGAPPVVGPPRKQQRDLDAGPWVSGLLILVALLALAAGIYWWMQREPSPAAGGDSTLRQPGEAAVRSKPRDNAADDAADADSPGSARETAGDDPGRTSSQTDPSPPAEQLGDGPVQASPLAAAAEPVPRQAEVAAPSPQPGAGGTVELRLAYSGDCWTEITDANGERLFFDLGRAGRTITVRGVTPVRVLVGNDENVNITVDGRSYAIAAADRRGNTARFTIRR
ncbi:MAG: RodZ domain-containing protein [Woeseia sp.]